MSRLLKNKSSKIGASPGSLVMIGKRSDNPMISVSDFSKGHYSQRSFDSIRDALDPSTHKRWIDIVGLNPEIIEDIGERFTIHPLICEDILNTDQRPKAEVFDNFIFITLKMLATSKEGDRIDAEQISFILMKGTVISFQEKPGDLFDPVRKRMQDNNSKIPRSGPDYLTYALIDVIVDNYFSALETIGERIEHIEEELMIQPKPDTLRQIYHLKKEAQFLRKSIWPLREAISKLERSETPLISKKTKPYLRDVYDHIIHLMDAVETSRDLLSGMLDLYISSVSNKMNEVMKVLTIIATIFIPLTFIVGVYGMNFEFMPELSWRWGYASIMIFMLILASSMLYFFRKKKWIA